MSESIHELKDIPGVLGACMFHSQEGPLQDNLPANYTAEKISKIIRLLVKCQAAGRMNFPELSDLSLHFENSVIVVRELGKNLIVFVLCDPAVNQNLVSASLNMLQQERENQQDPETPSTSSALELDQILAALKGHLPKIFGPMAGIIFDEATETWQKKGNASISTLDALIQIINTEIEDEDKIAHYGRLIAPILQQATQL